MDFPEVVAHDIPICSMYGIFTYIWVIIKANVGKYTIHGAYDITVFVDRPLVGGIDRSCRKCFHMFRGSYSWRKIRTPHSS